jgi:hypothetical protein
MKKRILLLIVLLAVQAAYADFSVRDFFRMGERVSASWLLQFIDSWDVIIFIIGIVFLLVCIGIGLYFAYTIIKAFTPK